MKLYLDSVILIDFLYSTPDEIERRQMASELFTATRQGKVESIVSLYALPELFSYVQRNYPADISNTVFRESMIVLFDEPVTVVPYLNRIEVNRLRRQFTIADAYDALHVACALFHNCQAIVTYDSHFKTVDNVITVMTPQEVLS